MSVSISGEGTSEDVWRGWAAPREWPELDLEAAGIALTPVVVAPHPDDEVFGVGGVMTVLGGAQVVAVTDGDAAHPGAGAYSPAQLAIMRRFESAQALRRLGLRDSAVRTLGQLDGAVDEKSLAKELEGLLRPGQWCFATWRGDGHPDHEAVGRASAEACERTGARLWEYPIWMWHWARPDDPRVPWHRARRVTLRTGVLEAKRHAAAAYESQLRPLGPGSTAPALAPTMVERLLRDYEVVFG
ncbi:PIG-L deacetylase family protein [Actinoalloteichus spitiensis]|uniref:PIG-L deacetylase family protein n=1 Tax=Actinoalloteichus spitiensis TaxID=252394 RepID=UPI000381DF7F|nr:PIG-L deacetylase family protein [Actinoalloteichus spitiensis]